MEITQMDDLGRYRFLSGLAHSPDGKYACFVVHQGDLKNNTYRSDLWLLDTKSGIHRQLTTSGTVKSFLWIDATRIIFPDLRGGENKNKQDKGEVFTQYYEISLDGGEAVKSFCVPGKVTSIQLMNDNNCLLVADYNMNHQDKQVLGDEEKDYEVLEEIPYWSNGGGFTSRRRHRFYKFVRATGALMPITDEYTNVEKWDLNPSKTKAVLIANRFTDKMAVASELLVYDLASETVTNLTQGIMRRESVTFLDDDTVVFTASDMQRYGRNENRLFFRLTLSTGEQTCLTPALDLSLANAVGSDCRYGASTLEQAAEDALYFVATEGYSSQLCKLERDGSVSRLTGDEGSVDGISIAGESMLYIGMRGNKLQEVYKVSDGRSEQLTTFNEWVQSERFIVQPEHFCVETAPGVTLDGWVMKPFGFEKTKRYPAILDIHGGPRSAYGSVFFHEMQYWAAQGYVVFFCNPRGGDGKGNKFADIRGKYGTIDYDDLMHFTDAVLAKCAFIDQQRIGVTGGSYGGFMTNWIIGHTDRFQAAVSQRSISNWISKFCTTDIGYYFAADQMAADPWGAAEKMWWHSPLKYANQVKTPTLFLHSEEDYRCWLAEGLQMFTALKYFGVESRLCMFRGENHELSRSGKPKHRLRRLNEITQWFDKYLKA